MINESFKAMFSTMSEREIYVLARRFGLGGCDTATLQEIGEELSVTRERIRQIEAKAIRKARVITSRNGSQLSDYVGS